MSPGAEPRLPARPPVGSSFVLDENALRFAPDSADLLDPRAADQILVRLSLNKSSMSQHVRSNDDLDVI